MEPDESVARRTRKPLTDCTNIVSRSLQSSSSSASVIKPASPSLSAGFIRVIGSTRSKESGEHKIGVSTRSSTRNRNESDAASSYGSVPRVSSPATPSRLRNSPFSQADPDTCEPYSVYARRKTSSKRKAEGKTVSEPVDFLLTERIPGIGEKTSETNISIPKALNLLQKKKQHQEKREQDNLKQKLRRDFIKTQRAYFQEIDAFELPEEERLGKASFVTACHMSPHIKRILNL